MDSEPSLCARGCGFFGTPENKNLCSKCHNDMMKEQVAKQSAALEIKTSDEELPNCPPPPPPPPPPPQPEEEKTGAKKRCRSCNRKVGLLGFECRCGHVYCGTHRHPEEHCCPSDYRTAAREAVAKANPLIKSEKLNRI